jgi:hypothetical protein
MDHTLTRALSLGLLLLAPSSLAQQAPTERVPAPMTHTPARLIVPDGAHSLQAYDVGDLTNSVNTAFFSPDAISTDDLELAEERLAQLEDLEELRRQAAAALASLEEVVRLTIEPPLVEGIDELRPLGDNLLVLRASDAQHAWLVRFLDTQRSTDSLISMTTTVWSAPHGFGRELQLGVDGQTQRLLETRLDVEDILSLATALGHESLAAPKLLTYPRQRGNVSVLNQISYVSGWNLVKVAPNEQLIADPVIDVIKEGLTVDARAVPLAPGYWSIDAEVLLTSLERPIPTVRTMLGDSMSEVEFATPTVNAVGMSSRFTIASGGGALFLTYDQIQDRDVIVLLQVEDFDPAEAYGRK